MSQHERFTKVILHKKARKRGKWKIIPGIISRPWADRRVVIDAQYRTLRYFDSHAGSGDQDAKGEIDLAGLTAKFINSTNDRRGYCEFGLFDSMGREVVLFGSDSREMAEEVVSVLNEIASFNYKYCNESETSEAIKENISHGSIEQEGLGSKAVVTDLNSVERLLSQGSVNEAQAIIQDYLGGRFSSVNSSEFAALYSSMLVAQGNLEEANKVSCAIIRGYCKSKVDGFRILSVAKCLTLNETMLGELEQIGVEKVTEMEANDQLNTATGAELMLELGSLYYQHKNYDEAENSLLKSFAICKKLADSPSQVDNILSDCTDNLALMFMDVGRFIDAETMFRVALPLKEKLLGPNHFNTLFCQWNLSRSLLFQNQLIEARILCSQALSSLAASFGPTHSNCLSCLHTLIAVLDRMCLENLDLFLPNAEPSSQSTQSSVANGTELLTVFPDGYNELFSSALYLLFVEELIDVSIDCLRAFIETFPNYLLHNYCIQKLLFERVIQNYPEESNEACVAAFDVAVVSYKLAKIDDAYRFGEMAFNGIDKSSSSADQKRLVDSAELFCSICCSVRRFDQAQIAYEYVVLDKIQKFGNGSDQAQQAQQIQTYLRLLNATAVDIRER